MCKCTVVYAAHIFSMYMCKKREKNTVQAVVKWPFKQSGD